MHKQVGILPVSESLLRDMFRLQGQTGIKAKTFKLKPRPSGFSLEAKIWTLASALRIWT